MGCEGRGWRGGGGPATALEVELEDGPGGGGFCEGGEVQTWVPRSMSETCCLHVEHCSASRKEVDGVVCSARVSKGQGTQDGLGPTATEGRIWDARSPADGRAREDMRGMRVWDGCCQEIS